MVFKPANHSISFGRLSLLHVQMKLVFLFTQVSVWGSTFFLRKNHGLFAIFILLCAVNVAKSQVATPKYSNEFLAIGVGGRGMALAGTMSATVDDVTGGYWNPAALMRVKDDYQAALMHTSFFGGIANYDYIGFCTPIDSLSTLGATVIRLGIDDIPDTRFLYDANGAINYNNIKFFSAADYAFLISYARKIRKIEGLDAGVNLKVIHRVAGDFANAWGFGFDAALHYQWKGWAFGLMARDITTTFNAWSHNSALVADVYAQTNNVVPETSIELTLPQLHFGAARRWEIKKRFGVMPAIDLWATFDGQRNTLIKSDVVSLEPVAGLELDYIQMVFLRAGVGTIQQIKAFDGTKSWTARPHFGLGIHIKMFTLDYALADYGVEETSMYTHVFSLKASFNKQK